MAAVSVFVCCASCASNDSATSFCPGAPCSSRATFSASAVRSSAARSRAVDSRRWRISSRSDDVCAAMASSNAFVDGSGGGFAAAARSSSMCLLRPSSSARSTRSPSVSPRRSTMASRSDCVWPASWASRTLTTSRSAPSWFVAAWSAETFAARSRTSADAFSDSAAAACVDSRSRRPTSSFSWAVCAAMDASSLPAAVPWSASVRRSSPTRSRISPIAAADACACFSWSARTCSWRRRRSSRASRLRASPAAFVSLMASRSATVCWLSCVSRAFNAPPSSDDDSAPTRSVRILISSDARSRAAPSLRSRISRRSADVCFSNSRSMVASFVGVIATMAALIAASARLFSRSSTTCCWSDRNSSARGSPLRVDVMASRIVAVCCWS
mmetsp:Transcript_18239/g.63277  ORF Transcript_18239/g.63277 Transcript_18239/m.63277 type:complete len:385 (+) Transcript_18239:1800-2954(+)